METLLEEMDLLLYNAQIQNELYEWEKSEYLRLIEKEQEEKQLIQDINQQNDN